MPSETPARSRARWRRLALRAALGLTVILVTAVMAGALLLRTAWAHERARRLIVSQASRALGADVGIRELRGALLGDLQLSGVTITQDGVPAVSVEQARVRYRPWRVITTRVVDGALLQGLRINAVETESGWNLAHLGDNGEPADSAPAGTAISIDRVEVVQGSVSVQPRAAEARHIEDLALAGAVSFRGEELQVELERFSARETTDGAAVHQLAGHLTLADGRLDVDQLDLATSESRLAGEFTIDGLGSDARLNAHLEAKPLSMPEMARYLPAIGRATLVPDVTLVARGPLSALEVELDVQSGAGQLAATGRASLSDQSTTFAGDVTTVDLNLAPWLAEPSLESRITGRASVEAVVPRTDGAAVDVTFRADARRVAVATYEAQNVAANGRFSGGVLTASVSGGAYRGTVDAAVRWSDDSLSSRGAFRGIDARRLPRALGAPPLQTNLAGRYALSLEDRNWSADATLDRSAVEGGIIEAGTTVAVASRAGMMSYKAKGRVAGIDPARLAPAAPKASRVLARAAGHVNAAVTVDGQGTSLAEASGTVDFEMSDSSVAGVSIRALNGRGVLADRRLIADLRADFSELTQGAVGLGAESAFSTAGTLDAHIELPDVSAPDPLGGAAGHLKASLGQTTAREIPFDSIEVAATLAGEVVQVSRLSAAGRDVTLTAKGPLALDPDGRSDLAYDIDVSDLAVLRGFTDTPLAGGVHLSGRLAGGYPALTAAGTLRAHSLRAGELRALSLDGTYDAAAGDVSAFRADAVRAKFDGRAAFVEAGETRLDRVTARGTYAAGELDLDATFEDRTRSLTISGALVPHPDHREIHIRDLLLATAGTEFRMTSEMDAVVQYGPERLAVRHLEIATSDGRVTIDGEVGSAAPSGASLAVTIERVPVEAVNRVLLGTHRLTGTIDAVARLDGSLDALRVGFDGTVNNGEVDGVSYERLSGKGRYEGNAAALDLVLEAGPEGRLRAAGTMPVRFGANAPADAPPFDLRVESRGLNLGLMQPLTPAISAITGRGDIDVRVTGPASAPTLAGSVAVGDAGFTVPATDVVYSGLQARLEFEGNRLLVRELRVRDDDGHVATVTGGLNVSVAAPPTDFDLYLTAEDFHVLGNQFGELSLSVDLHALGDLTTPLLVGTIEVDRARLEVDDLLDRFASTGYTPHPEEDADPEKPATPASSASYSIALALPDNVVLRGRDLRTASGSFGLGDINVTIGGALVIAKESGQPASLRGRLDVVRGRYAFQGRQFDIVRGSQLGFSGRPMLDPDIDVTAERHIGAVTAIVRVAGTARAPRVAISSTPPLDEGDVLSLIVFNQTMNELGTAQRVSLAARAGTLAARAVAAPIADSVARALDFDLFEIQPNEDASTGATISIGRQVSDRFFVGFRQDFGAGDVSQVSFEYRLTEFLRLVTSFAQGADRARTVPRAEAAGIDLFFVIRRE